ncbi:sensor histidine kinase [uncultured Brevundimonas sp.]|uniref:sensor histidine kinase n=1 Tax=uncultured Brevundimonas sp. TaxID=213418 RepID=UPI002632AC64|nr:PAS domain-containing sensor histidine kinase [uncultured Brevundimonas sp.]
MPTTIPAIQDARTLAAAIVDTIHEPLIVLDGGLRVLAASRAFYEIFRVDPGHTMGRRLYDLGDGQWNIPALRLLLETIIPEKTAMDGFEVDHDFPGVGRRTMLLNARKVISETSADSTILLAFTDVTARRAVERDLADLLEHTEELLRQKQVLLQEMQHRVANSLQIIASILLIKARAVTSEETRLHLRDAHQRVLSVAEVQSHLHASGDLDQIEVGPYLTKLCASLAASMIGDSHPIVLRVEADHGLIGSDKAVSMGLIVTELVINAIKYAFPEPRADAVILVRFESAGEGWLLAVTDNGVGALEAAAPLVHGGLGTAIVEALVKQLDARMQVESAAGMAVSIRHAGA